MVNLVKTLMSLRGFNQSELARHSGVSFAAISRFLNDHTDIRSEALVKILATLGTDLNLILKEEVSKSLGNTHNSSLGEDLTAMIENSRPITRKTLTDTIIACFKNDKNAIIQARLSKLRSYRDSIQTVKRRTD